MTSPASKSLLYQKPPAVSEVTGLLFITLVGAILRLYRLSAQSIWFDEASSIAGARGGFVQILQSVAGQEGCPPLYFLLLRLVTALGDSEFVVRLLSVLAGVAAIPLIYPTGCSCPAAETSCHKASSTRPHRRDPGYSRSQR